MSRQPSAHATDGLSIWLLSQPEPERSSSMRGLRAHLTPLLDCAKPSLYCPMAESRPEKYMPNVAPSRKTATSLISWVPNSPEGAFCMMGFEEDSVHAMPL